MKKQLFILTLFAALFITLLVPTKAYAASYFNDVPDSHWALSYINKLKDLGVTSGVGGGNFGLGNNIKRAEFVTFLANLLKLNADNYSGPIFKDNNENAWYYNALNIAKAYGISDTYGELFRPEELVTREEMAIMLINALGYQNLATRLSYLQAPFSDVANNKGYISMAKDFGIISGITPEEFGPSQTATKEQAAAMIIRMYNIMNSKTSEINTFYAVSSYNQINLISSMDSVCFGWARIETDGQGVWLNTTSAGDNEYRIPSGYEEPWNAASGKKRLLMVAVKDTDSQSIINNSTLNAQASAAISDVVINGLGGGLVFDGVVLDFEALKGSESKGNYTRFVNSVRENIGDRLLYVAVHPERRPGHDYYDAYDYKAIGIAADKVILMAHDYNAKRLTDAEMSGGVVMTPAAPIEEVYYALKAITDSETGVSDKSKVMLQINFAAVQWKRQNGAVINQAPYTPNYNAINERLLSGAELVYDNTYASPYITFYNEADSTDNVVWFENSQSVEAKIRLAGMFSINGVSLWRLGSIPDYSTNTLNVYNTLLSGR